MTNLPALTAKKRLKVHKHTKKQAMEKVDPLGRPQGISPLDTGSETKQQNNDRCRSEGVLPRTDAVNRISNES